MFLAACGGGSKSHPLADFDPFIQLTQQGPGAWHSNRADELTEVSNNGLGYTGEIDHFAIEIPERGRLLVSLTWEGDADYDIILAADEDANTRLVEGIVHGFEPEYVATPVAKGQTVHVFVAGWNGEPGAYNIETLLVPFETPVFALETTPDFTDPWPANRPLTFTFTVPLDPDQDVEAAVYFVCQGRLADGHWCIDGNALTFYPDLPEFPGDIGGLQRNALHTIQFPRAARGLRAENGEYLDQLGEGELVVEGFEDPLPDEPPRILATSPVASTPWSGDPILLELSEPVDPDALGLLMLEVLPDGTETLIAFRFELEQRYDCDGAFIGRISVAPDQALASGNILRVVVSGASLGLSGIDTPANGVTGPPPWLAGAGFEVDFPIP